MKKRLLLPLSMSMLAMAGIMLFAASCSDDDEKLKTIPEVTTAAVTDITLTSATGGGTITSTGNGEILASGLVYSSVNETPTISDSKTETETTSGTFTSTLEGLTFGTLYYVRAYATNSVGTGYGAVVPFTTIGNSAPVATNVSITGDIEIDAVLTGTYAYTDAESDAESGTTFQWYTSDTAGGELTAIEGATSTTYIIQAADEFKFIVWGVIVKAATGTTTGVEVKSAPVGPVPEAPETVTFTYNEQEVTYGVIISSLTGRKWLDRNLGSPNAPTAYNDYPSRGDLFQWGRAADGHQLVTRDAINLTCTPVNGTTTTLSDSDNPGHNLFIINSVIPRDWRSSRNDNLWQVSDNINNPCPAGWHVPSAAEWDAENLTTGFQGETGAFARLNITQVDGRSRTDGSIITASSYYWSSTAISLASGSQSSNAYSFSVTGPNVKTSDSRAAGHVVRCIAD